jgi:hypothetical protein
MANIVGVLLLVMAFPTLVFAQAQIAGTVKDSSGAILPGVTVEASSPALIEKTRTAVTDGTGQYKVIDLRPGIYVVAFTLPGFSTVKREGVELTGNLVASINIEMRVGSLEETLTVTGETPTVDVQSSTSQRVLSMDVINAMPAGRNFDQIASFVPGVSASGINAIRNTGNVIGGSSSDGLEFHGTVNADSRITVAGISVMTLQAGGGLGRSHPDMATASEVTIDTSSVSADLPTGGVRMNLIPRDGGNDWHGTGINSYTQGSLQGNNYTDRVKNLGLPIPGTIDYNWDLNGGMGGPFKRDRVWFWLAGRKALLANNATIFENVNAYKPDQWLYVPGTKTGQNKGRYQTLQLRTTWQATPRNKIAMTYKYDGYCQCPSTVTATTAPEAGIDARNPRLRQEHLEWTSPMTNRLLVEAVGMHLFERWGSMDLQPRGSLDDPQKLAILPQMISVTDQSNNLTYRNAAQVNNTLVPNYAFRAAVSYVTGAHSFKFGINDTFGFLKARTYTPSALPVSYRFNNGVPNQITLRAYPLTTKTDENRDFGAFIQDRWTVNRITLNGALRFDNLKTSAPELDVTPSPLTPNRNITFPKTDILSWKDLSFRSGVVYDLRGDGKTAVKISLNKYLNGQTLNTIGSAPAPANALVSSTTRTWTDDGRNGGIANDYVPQCDLLNPAANGECAAWATTSFGTTVPGTRYDPKLLSGFGVRPYNYEVSASVQRELMARVSLDVGYFRRIWGNFNVTDNLAVSAADYDRFSIVAPVDARLPGGGGYTLNGLYDLKPASFGRPTQNFVTLSDNYGKQIQHWNGVDVNVNARLRSGFTMQGGVSTGRTVVDLCDIAQQVPETLFGTANSNPTSFPVTATSVWTPDQYCHQQSPFLTQVKGQGVYIIPKIDVQLSGAFASTPGPLIQANFNAPNAVVLPSLGRALSGAAANTSVNLVAPGDMYGERVHELDISFGKIINLGAARRTSVRLDLYNALNRDTPVLLNNSYGAWQRPTDIVPARFAKITVTFDF